jgi:hypothetical protein
MKASKKIEKKVQQRSIHHNEAVKEASKKSGKNSADLTKSMKSPGSRNKKKIGAC